MPKHIENIREDLLSEARRQMLDGGYDSVTIRSVDSSCDIAVGTVYNYFESKEYLVACVMLEDWNDMILATGEKIRGKSPSEGIRKLYKMISDFSKRYGDVWSQYKTSPGHHAVGNTDYRRKIELQVRDLISGLFDPGDLDKGLCIFLARILLRFASDGRTRYSDISPYIEKLIA